MSKEAAADICIIGAGSSGIVAAKTFHQAGIPFDCFEKGSGVGGNWRYNNDNGLSSAYRSLHINTNRNVMAYADYPMPAEYPMFPHHSQIIRYFDSYVDHFGFRDKITFGTAVTDVSRTPDGRYTVTTDTGRMQTYSHVVVANGHHWNPRYPDPPFPGTFAGETMHSHDYKVPEQIQGKKLLIIGIGNSAVDIACEAARQYGDHRVTISTRSGAYIIPNWLMGLPFDSLANPLTSRLPLAIQRRLLGVSLWLARGRQESYGVPRPSRPMLSEHPTISQDLLNLAGRGMIRFKPNIQLFDGRDVVFDDGSRESFDLVMFATGYRVSFPFFRQGFFNVEESNDLQLYRRVIHPDYPGLYFLGLLQPLGAIMPLAEIQAIWISRLIQGFCRLPDRQVMVQAIDEESRRNRRRYTQSARHTLQVDFHQYKKTIEREMRKNKRVSAY
ncbi:cation diffusion facilitator CzcD-associated flavoprotein CzcO [Spirosoma lacussanchae]|uniref:flavin-containing monooxygenase n=1 Tax=Spirosoma lacussanchae TaxID=1884249 RepID=UPI001109F9B6|nr:NAD(P)-binding domain-containing protein [Spirosoma lacussanchae]